MKQKHTWKDWLLAVRPWSFPASAMPVAVTLAYLWWAGEAVNWTNGVWALLNIIVFHAAGNTWSDYFDYRRGVDREGIAGVPTLTSGQFLPREIMTLSTILLIAAVAAGAALAWRTGETLWYIGAGGIACTLLYPALKYRALGDAVIFTAYALLPVLGTTYVATGAILWETLLIGVPAGFITVAILHSNNMRDMLTDRQAGIRTLAMTLGGKVSATLYGFEVLFPFVWVGGCVAAQLLPAWSLLTWLSAGMAWKTARRAAAYSPAKAAKLAGADEATAQLQLAFSSLFIVSFVVARLLP